MFVFALFFLYNDSRFRANRQIIGIEMKISGQKIGCMQKVDYICRKIE